MEPVNSSRTMDEIAGRVAELKALNAAQWRERQTIRDVMNNRRALQALVGKTIKDPDQRLPIANMIARSVQVLGTKLGRRPDSKVDPPISNDSDRARTRADKRARIIDSLDRATKLDLVLPQVARWTPGYGFTPAILRQELDVNGDPFPNIELRDPFHAFPGEWGTNQQPRDIAFAYTMTRARLEAMYPTAMKQRKQPKYQNGYGGAVILGDDKGGWGNQGGSGVEVYEYYNDEGCWWVVPETKTLLSFVPNLLSTPQFRVAKRFTFDEITGMADSAIGVMANMVRLALLATIATEDSVMAELVVAGNLPGNNWRRGRNAVNIVPPGTVVERMNSRVPFEAFQHFDRLQDQLRIDVGHSRQNDGVSPNSFVTGQGLQELASSDGLEVREYFTILTHFLQDLDSMRLQWLEKYYGDTEMKMHGVRDGAPFSETFTPSKDIAGDYNTRRVYGAMAGFDDATKIVTGLQLVQAGVLDTDSLRENIDGLENHTRIKERIRAEGAEKMFMASIAARADQGDPLATEAAIELLPEGAMKEMAKRVFAPPEEPAAEDPMAAMAPPGGPALAGPEDVQSVLTRLSAAGQATSNVQTVGQVA